MDQAHIAEEIHQALVKERRLFYEQKRAREQVREDELRLQASWKRLTDCCDMLGLAQDETLRIEARISQQDLATIYDNEYYQDYKPYVAHDEPLVSVVSRSYGEYTLWISHKVLHLMSNDSFSESESTKCQERFLVNVCKSIHSKQKDFADTNFKLQVICLAAFFFSFQFGVRTLHFTSCRVVRYRIGTIRIIPTRMPHVFYDWMYLIMYSKGTVTIV